MSQPIITQLSYFSQVEKKGTLVLLIDNSGEISSSLELEGLDKDLMKSLIELRNFKGERFKYLEICALAKNSYDRVIFLGVGNSSEFFSDDWIKLGGVCRGALVDTLQVTLIMQLKERELCDDEIEDFICGFKLRNYNFDKYCTNKVSKKEPLKIVFQTKTIERVKKSLERAEKLADAVMMTRDFVNEPANILGTEEFCIKIQELKTLGVEINVFDDQKLEKNGFAALLSVSRASRRPARLVMMQWKGSSFENQTIAFVGKGVIFDSGGISLKPSASMEEMKGDMAGAAAVVGTIFSLASRKAKVNVVGVVGLVENMPGGNALRPGDILTSLSGKTIEVINTDAEGRLVLADLLWFTKEHFKPLLMIDIATLTGAIRVALGQHYAGLFSNDDVLVERLCAAGTRTGERLWRMPLGKEYDCIVDSKIADMRNCTGRDAGSVTAAQFLKRFVGDTPWAHLDIAGTAIASIKNDYNESWGSGFGVRLLDSFAHYYEDNM
ncbi:MAG: leucyl aminopeptidase [Candidatus Tokpelaia sp. JSC161]|jgi:leucyl aminopeptidase|nr:MAG: leucyl aminopeptidase [Candidatus Tokpelaia sp. JSC161]